MNIDNLNSKSKDELLDMFQNLLPKEKEGHSYVSALRNYDKERIINEISRMIKMDSNENYFKDAYNRLLITVMDTFG